MDFEEMKNVGENWGLNNGEFQLIHADEGERKLVFSSANGSFYVICPEEVATGASNATSTWHVWSDDDSVLVNLQVVQEFLTSNKERKLYDVLEKVKQSLPSRAGAAKGSSEMEDEIEMDDDSEAEEGGQDEEEDDDEIDEAYYEQEDNDALEDNSVKGAEEADDSAYNFFIGQGSSTAVHRLIADLKNLKKAKGQFGVEGNPRGDNLFIWDVKLTNFPLDSTLGRDLQSFAQTYQTEPVVTMEMKFPAEYPMKPPFVRVVRPRFKFLTGHVTVGGSICMEMLAGSGWRPTNDIEGILVQIRAEIMSDKNTRLDVDPDRPYDEVEARQAFERMVQRYGWNK